MRTIIPIALLLAAAVSPPSGAQSAGSRPKVLSISMDGVIHPITTEIVSHGLEQAQSQHASAILIKLSTPGGLLDATRDLVKHITASPLPVITYVTPSGAHAASAGFFLLEAGNVAAMAPHTNTGAASPVVMGQQMDPVMRSKVENDTSALLRSLTVPTGRNADLAEKAIREAKAWSDQEALENHLIDLIAADEQDLFRQLEGREITLWNGKKTTLHLTGAEVIEAHRTWREQLMSALADPNLAFILLIIGALGVYVEFSHPGLILPGVVGAILALLGLSGLSVLPISWVGVALLLLSITLFVLEAKFTSHGVLGIGGTVSMILGAVLLIEGPPEMRIHLSTAIAVAVPFALITILLVSLVIKARANKVVTGDSGMIDTIGVVKTPLAPGGKVLVRGEYWDAISSTPLEPGSQVRVTKVDGLTLRVEPVADLSPTPVASEPRP